MSWNKLLTSKLPNEINDRYLLLKKLAEICVYKKIAGPVNLLRYTIGQLYLVYQSIIFIGGARA